MVAAAAAVEVHGVRAWQGEARRRFAACEQVVWGSTEAVEVHGVSGWGFGKRTKDREWVSRLAMPGVHHCAVAAATLPLLGH